MDVRRLALLATIATVSTAALTGAIPAQAATGGAEAPLAGEGDSGGASFDSHVEPAVEQAARRRAARRARARERAQRRARMRRLRRRERESPTAGPEPAPVPTPTEHVFPVQGPFSLGGPDSRFGAGRPGHIHQGQDLAAPLGTPVVAPWAGTVEWVKFQRDGAGHYIVLDGDGEDRDYVFMHLRPGSILVEKGEAVVAGQQLAQVGSSGGSSGPHLHFEIWVKGGWFSGGEPVDPYRFLRAWLS